VVIDTNVLLVFLLKKSPFHNLFQALLRGNFIICVSIGILLEYEEEMSYRFKSEHIERFFDELIGLNNCIFSFCYFQFNLIENDPDDNKFVDCAIESNSDYIITNDKHFNILALLDFPKVQTLTLQQFQKLLFPL
jgi:putative PIN family toxin of toxin-antitoxin system